MPQYDLKKSETNLLEFVRAKQQAVFSGILSTIVADRLAYNITENTQFSLSDDLKQITINEQATEQATEQANEREPAPTTGKQSSTSGVQQPVVKKAE